MVDCECSSQCFSFLNSSWEAIRVSRLNSQLSGSFNKSVKKLCIFDEHVRIGLSQTWTKEREVSRRINAYEELNKMNIVGPILNKPHMGFPLDLVQSRHLIMNVITLDTFYWTPGKGHLDLSPKWGADLFIVKTQRKICDSRKSGKCACMKVRFLSSSLAPSLI